MNKYEIVEESQGDFCYIYIKENGITQKVISGQTGDPLLLDKAYKILAYLKVNPLYEKIIWETANKKIKHYQRGLEQFLSLYINGYYEECVLLVTDDGKEYVSIEDGLAKLQSHQNPKVIETKIIYQEN